MIDALSYIHSLEKFGIKPGLERISQLLFALGNPQERVAAIHVAGTNGKGSTSTFMANILASYGLKVGLYCLYNQLTGNALSILSAQAQENLITASRSKIESGLQSLRNQGAEYAIAVLHMGTEGYYEPTEVQYDLCRHSIDCGFDAVYCTHAHRLQPAELYENGIIFYGMGNWSFGGHTNPGNGTDPGAYDTGIAKIIVRRCGEDVSLQEFSFIPCSISSNVDPETGALSANSVNNYQPTPYVKDSSSYNRAMSMLSGTYEGANYAVGNYWDLLARMG